MRKKSVRHGWVLVVILLIHLSGGLFRITPIVGRAVHTGAMGSEASTKQTPTDLRLDRETAPLARPDVFLAAAFLPGEVSSASGNSYPGRTPESLHHVLLDILQLQRVLRI